MRPRRSFTLVGLLCASVALVVGACAQGDSSGETEGGAGSAPVACAPDGAAAYCYPGPAATRGVGECKDGTIVCEGGQWSECEGDTQPVTEICDDRLDNDCNGVVDEGCPCDSGTTRACYTGPGTTRGVGVCADGEQLCENETWSSDCVGEVLPTGDEPCNEVDDNCNGVVDDGCSCVTGTSRSCYTGLPSTQNVGPCHDGTQNCTDGQWDPNCSGEQTPGPETCNSTDDDCDGSADEELGSTTCGEGPCARTVDNCTGGVTQTCTPLCDGVNCTSGSECATGFCKDGHCCNSACTTPCQLCVTGTCATVTNGYDDPECTGTTSCDASGSCKKVNGQTCSAASECVSGYCKDGRCCNTGCTAACQSCASGSCSTVANGDDSPECSGTTSCDATGTCKKINGQTCSAASECISGYCKDGRCCNTGCTAACQSCASGSCSTVANTTDNPECSGTNSCDATGVCKKINGQICSAASECVSGYCKDGKCCNTGCTTACQTCSTGSCTSITSAPDNPECMGTNSCDAGGLCKKINGQVCSAASECVSGYCKDGKCCNTGCTATCQTCSTGTCTTITNAPDVPECTGVNTCNASGLCRLKPGQVCVSGTQCASGYCNCDKYGYCTCL